jgi:hypothetical protein
MTCSNALCYNRQPLPIEGPVACVLVGHDQETCPKRTMAEEVRVLLEGVASRLCTLHCRVQDRHLVILAVEIGHIERGVAEALRKLSPEGGAQ